METKSKSRKIITLVVLSYQKQDFLRRLILLYRDFPCHLVIADGSNSRWTSGDSGELNNLTWQYFQIPSSQRSFKNYAERFVKSINLITSPYVVFIDDEEFLFPSGMQSAINYLNRNPTHSAAGGQIFLVEPENKYRVSTWGRKSTEFELLENKSIDRISKLVFHQRTANLMYQVVPTEIYQKFTKILSRSDFLNSIKFHSALEIFQSLFLAKQGNWKMQNYPYWIRIPGSINDGQSVSYFLTRDEMRIISRNLFRSNTKENYLLEKIMKVCWGVNSVYHRQSLNRAMLDSKKINSFSYYLKTFIKRKIVTDRFNPFEDNYLEEFNSFIKIIRDYPMGLSKKEFDLLVSKGFHYQ